MSATPPHSADPANALAGIVLCGGQSRRMGTSKALLRLGSESMLQRVVRLLRDAVEGPIIVVGPHGDATLRDQVADVVWVSDRWPDRGPLEGLACGLAAMPQAVDAAFVTSCDAPFLSRDVVAYFQRVRDGADAVVAGDGKVVFPLPAILVRSAVNLVEDELRRGGRRLNDAVRRLERRVVPVEELRRVDPTLRCLTNINTPADYRGLLKALDPSSD